MTAPGTMNRAADWLKQAERDLAAARHSAMTGDHEWTAFQSQQCAEKAVKALVLVLRGAPREPGVAEILQQVLDVVKVPHPTLHAAQELDKVYVTSRYPDSFATGAPADYFTDRTSKELIGFATQILEFCRSQIP